MALTLNQWRMLSEEEKIKRYKELSKHDMFLERIGGRSNEELTPEEKKFYEENRKMVSEAIKKHKKKYGWPGNK